MTALLAVLAATQDAPLATRRALADETPAADEAPKATPISGVEVRSRRSVTVVGQFESLQAVVEELCEKSGVALRTYTATDRAITANYVDLPLRDVFERLLSRESFVLGVVKRGGDERTRLTWIRVVESSRKVASAPRRAATKPVVLPRVGFTSPDSNIRRRVTVAWTRRLQNDVAYRMQFLKTGDRALINQLARGRHSEEFLQQAAARVGDAAVRAKLTALRRSLAKR